MFKNLDLLNLYPLYAKCFQPLLTAGDALSVFVVVVVVVFKFFGTSDHVPS